MTERQFEHDMRVWLTNPENMVFFTKIVMEQIIAGMKTAAQIMEDAKEEL